jgi:uncharacterized heparinase superfamily protein
LQAENLFWNFEWHLRGNHIFENAKALVFAACYFDGAVSERWGARGWKILMQQMDEQILQDGGHMELSPMYHCMILEGLLDIWNLLNAYRIEEGEAHRPKLFRVIKKMLRWIEIMTHPDGKIALFNDSVLNYASSPMELRDYARRVGITFEDDFDEDKSQPAIVSLKQSGFVKMSNDSFYALIDAGAIGPDYLPAHGHADALSIEVSVKKEQFLVNRGTHDYGEHPLRLLSRKTKSHNTVEVAGKDSSEVWSNFRVGARANVKITATTSIKNVHFFEAFHDGYKSLKPAVMHHRSIKLTDDAICIEDTIEQGLVHGSVIYFYVHPAFTGQLLSKQEIQFQHSASDLKVKMRFTGVEVEINPSIGCRRFGFLDTLTLIKGR